MQPPLWPQIILQLFLLILSALLSAGEGAVSGLNEAALRRRAEENDPRAQRLLPMVEQARALHTAARTGCTLAGLFAAAFAAIRVSLPLSGRIVRQYQLTGAAAWAVEVAAVLAVALVLCVVTLVFARLVPSRLAAQRPEGAALAVWGSVRVVMVLLAPLNWLLTAAAGGVLRMLHIDPAQQADPVSEEGIRKLVDIGEEKGAIESGEKEMIENIFEFNNNTASDVMVHRTEMVMLWAEDTADEVFAAIEESGLSRFPVYEEDADDVIGILNVRDFLLNARRPAPKPLRELLRPAYFVPESVRADVLFRDMQSRKVHLSIVVDEYGGTAGLVTMEDLLEEIVGNIYDEFDPQEDQEIIPLGEGRWRIAGGTDLDDVAEALGVEFPEEEESETLGGLVFAQLSVIPEDGSRPEVEAHGLRIQVEELADRRVEWALVSRTPAEACNLEDAGGK